MKKVFFAVLALGALSLTSCKKDYTCDCSVTATTDDGAGTTTSATTESSYTLTDAKKKDAEAWCTAWDESSTSATIGTFTSASEYSCSLK